VGSRGPKFTKYEYVVIFFRTGVLYNVRRQYFESPLISESNFADNQQGAPHDPVAGVPIIDQRGAPDCLSRPLS
jgi:hypothetical protein